MPRLRQAGRGEKRIRELIPNMNLLVRLLLNTMLDGDMFQSIYTFPSIPELKIYKRRRQRLSSSIRIYRNRAKQRMEKSSNELSA